MASILVVDDEVEIRSLVRLVLEEHGHKVDEARDGFEAMGMSLLRTYDLVLLDMMMPRVSGPELIEWWRARRYASPVVVMTAAPHLAPPGVRVLSKPFQMTELLLAVQQERGPRTSDADLAFEGLRSHSIFTR